MKRMLAGLFAALFLLAAGACARNNGSENAVEKIKVVTTIFPPYDFVRAIAGDKAELTMLLPPGSESHSYEPSPQDMARIQNCDVFIYVGGKSETWVRGVLEALDTENITVLALMDMVDVVEEEIVEGMEHEHDAGDGHDHGEGGGHDVGDDHDHDHDLDLDVGEYDEHVWTSPKNAAVIVRAISEALCAVDEKNAENYRANTEAYLEELTELDRIFEEIVAACARRTLVFGDRFPFRYFAEAYGLKYYAAFPGCSQQTEPSAKTVAFLIEKVRAEGIPVVFYIEMSRGVMADTICEATGAKKRLFHSCHTVSREDFLAGKTYLELMAANAEALKEALSP
jgi:zinc transport system substrate-binding protein